ncbi:MAG: M20 metallopeptidase family protein [Acidimicrobiales bacterium]
MHWLPAAVADGLDESVDTRRWFHTRPELSFEEHETSRLILDRLGGLGLEIEACPTPTGAVASLSGGRPGRTVLIRADIDALPVHEEVELDFRSSLDGQMHACGHDAHGAILLSVAQLMAGRADDLPGRYVFLFQPAEEKLGGARRMIEGGVLDGLGAEASVALHVTPELPVGLIGLKAGTAMSASHAFRVLVRGPGGHGAVAGRQGNVVLAVADLAGRLPGTVEGLRYEEAHCACSTGMIHAGTAPNVVPQLAELRGTLRTYTADQSAAGVAGIEDVCRMVADDFGVEVELDMVYGTPPVVNDIDATNRVRRATQQVLGGDRVLPMPPVAPSDDMSEFLALLPGCYYFVGAGDARHPSGAHHSPTFRLDEGCLETGALSLAAAAIGLAESDLTAG